MSCIATNFRLNELRVRIKFLSIKINLKISNKLHLREKLKIFKVRFPT